MRILHFFKTYHPDSYGGVEQTIKQICLSTQKLGVTNRILTLSKNPEPAVLHYPEAEIHRCYMNFEMASTGISFSAFKTYKKLLAWADVVHYHFPWPFADLLYLAAPAHRSVVTYHSDILRQKTLLKFYKPLMNYFLNKVDNIIVTSPNYLASSQLLKKFHNKTSIIPIGLDENTYPRVETGCLQKWRARVGEEFFLFVGVLRYYKGLHILLEAIKDNKLPVVIVGSGPTENELKLRAQALNITNIKFLGSLPDEDKVALFQLCRAVVFPSHLRTEAFGVSLLEGAMFAKPLISCELSTGSSYINQHQQTGLIVQPSDAVDLRKAMDLINDNASLRTQMGENAKQRYQQLFTADSMAKQYVAVYKTLIQN